MDYILHIATLFMIYLLLAESMNLYLGHTGLLALSHIAFYGIGAYSGALIMINYGTFWPGFFLGGILAAILGLILGLTSIKLRADYLGIVTLGFGQIVHALMQNWTSLTRGPLGLSGISRPEILRYTLNEKWQYFLFVLIITAILMFVMYRMVKSPFGRILETIRDDEVAAKSIGKNTTLYKLIAFSIGAMIAAFAGALMACFIKYIDPASFQVSELALVLVMTVIGGLGTFRGPFLGVAFILLIQEGVTFIDIIPAQYVGASQLLLYSLIFLLAMIYFPQGLGGWLKTGKRRSKQFTRY